MHGLISDSKLTVGVNGSLSFCLTNCPAYTLPIALDSWDGLQFPVTLNWKSGRNWKDRQSEEKMTVLIHRTQKC